MTLRNDHSHIDQVLTDASTTREVVIRNGAVSEVGQTVSASYRDRTAIIVADDRTFGVAGRAALISLQKAGCAVGEPIVFPAEPTLRPDTRHVERIRDAFEPETLPVAVGSGTINDLTKRAAFEAGVPYIVVATAASMDGYTASGAALVSDGVKQTFECPAAEVVVADLAILRDAPQAMTASGYGDLVGKVTAGADWVLADFLGIEPILPYVWDMVQAPLRGMISEPERFFRGDEDAIARLFEGLVMTGLSIQVAGTTRPASGSEHQFSHLWEMRGLEHEGEPVSHGMKVALGSIVSTTIYERLLASPIERLDIERAVAARPEWTEMESHIRQTQDHPMLVEKALEECRAKYISSEELRERLTLFRGGWPELKERLRNQLLSTAELSELLRRAHCPTKAEDVGLSREQMRESYLTAGQIRRRYTVFDIVSEAGLLIDIVDQLFGPNGYWLPAEGARP
jgi:glycerol-1-phosphate dehydrogenase [NAD(P)+]